MSAWTVYLLFQLDSIKIFLGASTALILFIVFLNACFRWNAVYEAVPYGENYDTRASKVFVQSFKLWVFLIPIFVGMLISLIPSTKTMAAIIILPKIASSENLDMVGKDGKEIYQLGMARIKEALGEIPEKQSQ